MIPIPFTVLWLIALIVFAVGEAITVGLTSVWSRWVLWVR